MMNILFCSFVLFSQTFGQNKVQYKDFGFKVLSTEHFDIYFSQGGEELAAFAKEVLEDKYTMFAANLGIEVEFRTPVILYNCPNDFSQTNVTLELIEESTGGFAEILKNRMVIPFTGDYEEFRHVLVHELSHVFQFKIFFPSKLGAILSGDFLNSIPLWVMEGHAEFSSLGWNIDADIFMRDLIMNNNVIPLSKLGDYSGYIIYKEGQAFYNYIANKYGSEKIGRFINGMKSKENLDAVFTKLFGVTVDDFNNQWVRYYQMKYFPKIELQDNFDKFTRIAYNHKKTHSLYNTSTAISSKGDKIAFVSDRSGVAEVIIISSIDGEVLKKLVKAEYSSSYEGLHLYQGGLSWSPDDRYLTFAAKSKGKDVLYILNARNGKVHKKFGFDIDGIYSPKFSPNGEQIVFSGLKDGHLDIYILNIKSKAIKKLTDDVYADKYPSFSSEGAIAFVSDRPDSNEEYTYGNYAIFVYTDGIISRLTPRASYMASPFFDPEGGLFFVANYDSAYNLYWYSYDSLKTIKRTDILTGVFYPTISADGFRMAFSYFNNCGYDVCVVKNPLTKMENGKSIEKLISKFTYEKTELVDEKVQKYKPKFTVDYFTLGASYYSVLGLSGLSQIAISDILGDHRIELAIDLYGSLTNSDMYLTYWYLKQRIDIGITLFQHLNYFCEDNDFFVWRYLGCGGILQYPFDRFFRIELGAYAYKIYETRWFDYLPSYFSDDYHKSRYHIFYPSLAFVFDNTKWGSSGPLNGRRVRVDGYATVFGDFKLKSLILDYRRYFQLSPRASFASRFVGGESFGPDAEHFSIGGSYSLRGFDYYALSGSKLGFANFEYRFPFVDRLKLSFPLPIEFSNIGGVLFTDLGGVYTDSFAVYNTNGGFHLQDLKMGIGTGLRINFLSLTWQFDVARSYNFQEFTNNWKYYLTIGSEW